MKQIFVIIIVFFSYTSFGQNKIDSNSFEFLCEYDYKVDFKIPNNYYKVNFHRAFIPTYDTWSCMPYFFKEALVKQKKEKHYKIYFDFNLVARSKYESKFIRKYFDSNYSNNTNYLGGINCKTERDRDLMQVYSNEDFKKYNADTMLCIRVDSNARRKNDPILNDFIYIVMHKENIGDIYVCFAYKKEYEFEVMDEIKNLWKIIKFK